MVIKIVTKKMMRQGIHKYVRTYKHTYRGCSIVGRIHWTFIMGVISFYNCVIHHDNQRNAEVHAETVNVNETKKTHNEKNQST